MNTVGPLSRNPWVLHFFPSFWVYFLLMVVLETNSLQRATLGLLEFAYSVSLFRFFFNVFGRF